MQIPMLTKEKSQYLWSGMNIIHLFFHIGYGGAKNEQQLIMAARE